MCVEHNYCAYSEMIFMIFTISHCQNAIHSSESLPAIDKSEISVISEISFKYKQDKQMISDISEIVFEDQQNQHMRLEI